MSITNNQNDEITLVVTAIRLETGGLLYLKGGVLIYGGIEYSNPD